jgi:anaerobic selenocysteine-containing dehydrogenase
MSLITGKNWGWGFHHHAYGVVPTNATTVEDAMLGAIDAPGCIPAGSHVADACHSYGAASTALVRVSGRATTVSIHDLF